MSRNKIYSVLFSIIIHAAFIIPIIKMYTGPVKPEPDVIEIGLGNGGESGGGMGGSPAPITQEEKIPEKQKSKTEKKPKTTTPEKKTEKSDKELITSTTGTGNGQGTGTGTASGPGSGTGTGNGTGTGGTVTPLPPVVKKDETYYVAVEVMPELLGDIQSKLPQALQNTGKGTVYVLAFIDENGAVRKVMLSKGIGSPYDEAALNAVRRSRFRPGKKQGVTVRVQYHITVTF